MTFKKIQKISMKLLFVFTFALTCLIFTSNKAFASVVNGFDFKPGDIVITKSTSSSGVLGHAGMVLPDGSNIVHIAGPKFHSTKLSIDKWLRDYPSTKVVRGNESKMIHPMAPLGASYCGKNYFVQGEGTKIPYALTPGLGARDRMYCSKLVWQCYAAAGLEFKVPHYNAMLATYNYVIPPLLSPYDFLGKHALEHNGFSVVKSFNW